MQKTTQFFVSISLFFFLFLEFFHPSGALVIDLGRELKLGEIILTTWHIVNTNLFSYTFPSFITLDTHWLSEVIYALVLRLSGLVGLFILTTITALLTLIILYVPLVKKVSLSVLSLIAIAFLFIIGTRNDIRPEIFSFFLTAYFSYVLYRYREKFTKLIWTLPVLMLLWVNLHIYFLIGLILLGIFSLDLIFHERKHLRTKHVLVLLTVTILSFIASLINPNGIVGVLYPLLFTKNFGYPAIETFSIFAAWQYAPANVSIAFITVELSIAAYFILGLIRFKKMRVGDWLIGIAFAYIGCSAARNIPLLIIVMFIPLTLWTDEAVKKFIPKGKKWTILGVFALVAFLFLIHAAVLPNYFGYAVWDWGKNGVDFFQKEHIKGPIFNNIDIGSYLAYRLYPQEKVFVDIRPEAYPASFFQNTYIPMLENPRVFYSVDNKYHFNALVITHTDAFSAMGTFLKSITNDPQWRMVYLDDYMVIYLRNNKENASPIQKFGMTRGHIRIALLHPWDGYAKERIVSFLQTAGWTQDAQESSQH